MIYHGTAGRYIGGEFDGREAKVKVSDNGGRTGIYYGGADKPDGDGHGHVTAINDQIQYWREPANEGGETLIDYGHDSQVNI